MILKRRIFAIISKLTRFLPAVPAGYALSGCAGASPLLPDGGSFCPAPILRRMLSIFYVILCNDLRL